MPQDAIQRSYRQVVIQLTGNCYTAFLDRMFIGGLASRCCHKIPAIIIEQLQNVSDFHQGEWKEQVERVTGIEPATFSLGS